MSERLRVYVGEDFASRCEALGEVRVFPGYESAAGWHPTSITITSPSLPVGRRWPIGELEMDVYWRLSAVAPLGRDRVVAWIVRDGFLEV